MEGEGGGSYGLWTLVFLPPSIGGGSLFLLQLKIELKKVELMVLSGIYLCVSVNLFTLQ